MAWGKRRPAEEPAVQITEDVLQVTPMRPENVELREDSHGNLHLRVSQPPKGFAKRVADWMKHDYTRTYELDEFGTFYYRMVNGHTKLKSIIRQMAKHFAKPYDEMELAVVQFTKMLMLKNMLALKMPVRRK